MGIIYAFAGLLVSNRDQAMDWYERLFGKPPDFLPNDAEAVWRVADTASVYVLADPARAGGGIVTLVVDNLDAHRVDLSGRGITLGAVETVGEAGRKSTVIDPDGNAVSFVELRSG